MAGSPKSLSPSESSISSPSSPSSPSSGATPQCDCCETGTTPDFYTVTILGVNDSGVSTGCEAGPDNLGIDGTHRLDPEDRPVNAPFECKFYTCIDLGEECPGGANNEINGISLKIECTGTKVYVAFHIGYDACEYGGMFQQNNYIEEGGDGVADCDHTFTAVPITTDPNCCDWDGVDITITPGYN